jgi:hypothetical protein
MMIINYAENGKPCILPATFFFDNHAKPTPKFIALLSTPSKRDILVPSTHNRI